MSEDTTDTLDDRIEHARDRVDLIRSEVLNAHYIANVSEREARGAAIVAKMMEGLPSDATYADVNSAYWRANAGVRSLLAEEARGDLADARQRYTEAAKEANALIRERRAQETP